MALPSLRNLQVFEVAARHSTLRAAAEALFLTHGAVSRQIRILEAELGVTLFTRTKQGIALTPQGLRLQAAVADALKLMTDATEKIGGNAQKRTTRLVVTALQSLATRWLLPRLPDFQAVHPDVDVQLISIMAPLNLAEKEIDLGVRNGDGQWDGLVSELLAQEMLFPVMARGGVAGRSTVPQSAQDLLDYPLLNPYDDWQRWFHAAGVTGGPSGVGKTLSDAHQLLQAVEGGKGIALGRQWLVADALASGALVRLPGPAITRSRSYYLVYPEGRPLSPAANAFAAWLRKMMSDA